MLAPCPLPDLSCCSAVVSGMCPPEGVPGVWCLPRALGCRHVHGSLPSYCPPANFRTGGSSDHLVILSGPPMPALSVGTSAVSPSLQHMLPFNKRCDFPVRLAYCPSSTSPSTVDSMGQGSCSLTCRKVGCEVRFGDGMSSECSRRQVITALRGAEMSVRLMLNTGDPVKMVRGVGMVPFAGEGLPGHREEGGGGRPHQGKWWRRWREGMYLETHSFGGTPQRALCPGRSRQGRPWPGVRG